MNQHIISLLTLILIILSLFLLPYGIVLLIAGIIISHILRKKDKTNKLAFTNLIIGYGIIIIQILIIVTIGIQSFNYTQQANNIYDSNNKNDNINYEKVKENKNLLQVDTIGEELILNNNFSKGFENWNMDNGFEKINFSSDFEIKDSSVTIYIDYNNSERISESQFINILYQEFNFSDKIKINKTYLLEIEYEFNGDDNTNQNEEIHIMFLGPGIPNSVVHETKYKSENKRILIKSEILKKASSIEFQIMVSENYDYLGSYLKIKKISLKETLN